MFGIGLSGFETLARLGDTGAGPTLLETKEVPNAEQVHRMEAPPVHRSCPGHTGARGRCSLQAELTVGLANISREGEDNHMLRKIAYALGALAMLAMAVGAGFKPA